jgi:hypothetical protein
MVSNKIPFEIVDLEVGKMYAKGLDKNETLNDFLIRVEAFIESCGWNVDEFDAMYQIRILN